jgi:hypothetical protein
MGSFDRQFYEPDLQSSYSFFLIRSTSKSIGPIKNCGREKHHLHDYAVAFAAIAIVPPTYSPTHLQHQYHAAIRKYQLELRKIKSAKTYLW